MQSRDSSYPSQQPFGSGRVLSGPSSVTANSTCSPPNPPRPLGFTSQPGGTPSQQQDLLANSMHAEPQQANYQPVPRRHSSCTLISLGDSPIKVTCLTKGSARSPYVTPMPSDVVADTDRSGRHNPYSFSYSGTSSPLQLSTPTHSPQGSPSDVWSAPSRRMLRGAPHYRRDPPAADERCIHGHCPPLDTPFELPPEVVHRSLKDRCRFIEFPASLSATKAGTPAHNAINGTNSSSNGSSGSAGSGENTLPMALFIGQVRFETTSAELLWLVHRTCGACASHLESRGAGCYLLYCKSEADLRLVRSLHKRVLFDIGGVWLARTASEVDAMCEYIALDAPLLSKKARLPRDSMVVEELKADSINNSLRRTHFAGVIHEKRNFSGNGSTGHRRGCARPSITKGLRADGVSQEGGNDIRKQLTQHQQQQQYRSREGLPTYEESAPPYPGYSPQAFMEAPPYK
ncbi:hypothetical protein LSCM1_03412 [Leishmania martiniquensis]|uniref:Uncharacterized protein n=1 Tax=Leishmania martiniquensis TaxID=1580590 RepID=A0A836GMN4_9TRYP|nr:hypothetical protein LSCM1_03412 [Leishmania martiniquensis]